jgi:hypothetical protein
VIERKNNGDVNVAVAKMLNLIGNIHLQRAEVNDSINCYTEASRIYKGKDSPKRPSSLLPATSFTPCQKTTQPECAAIA